MSGRRLEFIEEQFVVELIACSGVIQAAAARVGISNTSAAALFKSPEFREKYRTARQAWLQARVARLAAHPEA